MRKNDKKDIEHYPAKWSSKQILEFFRNHELAPIGKKIVEKGISNSELLLCSKDQHKFKKLCQQLQISPSEIFFLNICLKNLANESEFSKPSRKNLAQKNQLQNLKEHKQYQKFYRRNRTVSNVEQQRQFSSSPLKEVLISSLVPSRFRTVLSCPSLKKVIEEVPPVPKQCISLLYKLFSGKVALKCFHYGDVVLFPVLVRKGCYSQFETFLAENYEGEVEVRYRNLDGENLPIHDENSFFNSYFDWKRKILRKQNVSWKVRITSRSDEEFKD